jgi:hypothetical protein
MPQRGEQAVDTMAALGSVIDDADIAAHLVGTIYELAMRLGVSPRSIADNAFTSIASDEKWTVLEPALREALGRL